MQKVLAVDFDGCLCLNRYPEIGAPCWPVINAAKQRQRDGWALVLWTSRCGELLVNACEACKEWGLNFDAVNESITEWREVYQNDTRKIGATEYWDDKAVLMPAVASKTTAGCAAQYFQMRATDDSDAHVADYLAAYSAAAAQALQEQARRDEWAGTLFEKITRNPWELAAFLEAMDTPCDACIIHKPGMCTEDTNCKLALYETLIEQEATNETKNQ